jgi:ABC-type Fe3+/spermidine/putrescine transport system ATPase subunit
MSQVEGLVREYEGGFKVDIPKWEIPDHGITALWGPSGAGKTSVFRLLIGLEPCPGLKWNFGDLDLAAMPVPERRLGVVFQSLELFPHMTAKENIGFAARARQLPAEVERERLGLLVQDLRMEPFLNRRASVLSGGEAQRVALARALIAQPRFLFLDEPFSSLDSELRADARAMVKRAIEVFKVPTLLITHDVDDLAALANSVVKIKAGRIVPG